VDSETVAPPAGPSGLTRRQVLGLIAASGVAAAGSYALYEFALWLDVETRADQVRAPLAGASADLRNLVQAATLAASSHNTQPWTFVVGPGSIDIHPDRARQLRVLDPQGRELWISLGCALENLLIAAHAAGYAAQVKYPAGEEVIRVRLIADVAHLSPLLGAIPLRQNTRSLYSGQIVAPTLLRQLQAVRSEPGVTATFVLGRAELGTVLEYVNQGTAQQYADPAFVQELVHWLRFTRKDALATLDGLYTRSSGNPEVPPWLGRMFITQAQADAATAKFRSASGAVLISSVSDDRAAWVRTGQVYERLALQMTALGVQSGFLNQPIEVKAVRREFGRAMKLGPAWPQLLMLFGHAPPLPRSLRRPPEQVMATQ
jgi:hypothetical protein